MAQQVPRGPGESGNARKPYLKSHYCSAPWDCCLNALPKCKWRAEGPGESQRGQPAVLRAFPPAMLHRPVIPMQGYSVWVLVSRLNGLEQERYADLGRCGSSFLFFTAQRGRRSAWSIARDLTAVLSGKRRKHSTRNHRGIGVSHHF